MTVSKPLVPKEELQQRAAGLQEKMVSAGVDGVLILEKTDLFYYAGTSQQGWYYLPAEGQPLLMLFKDFDRGSRETALENVLPVNGTRELPQRIADFYPLPDRLGMELDVMPVNNFRQFEKLFQDTEIVDISLQIRLQRSVKSPYEIDKIRKAACCSDLVAEKGAELVCEGKTDVQLAGELEAYGRRLGHQGIVRMRMFGSELYWGHLMSGSAAAAPSYLASPTGGEGVSCFIGQGAGWKKIKRNEPILLDYVFALDGYISDHSRIFSIGSLSDTLQAAHTAMLEIQERMIGEFRPGAVTGDLYTRMVELAEEKGYRDNFMGATDKRIRFTGHGVGLELDEFPFIAKGQRVELEVGMVIALEPKVVFPGLGVVGIENCFLVNENGLESLGKFPDQICIVE